jgi:Fe-Mn family superoxide dismutase
LLSMGFTLSELPFKPADLEPFISSKTIEFHHGRHHRNYVSKLNELIDGREDLASASLEEVIRLTHDREAKIFNNAAQVWNHTFYWNCLTGQKAEIPRTVEARLEREFKSAREFIGAFTAACENLFGSGWVWLVADQKGRLDIRALGNAETPLVHEEVPLLTCDVWEHAYYLDYQNERKKYVQNYWQIVNWAFVESNFERLFAPDL